MPTNLKQAIYEELSGHAGLAALVSTRIYPGFAPASGTLPRVIINRLSAIPSKALDGDAGMKKTTLQIDSFGVVPESADDVAAQVRAAIDNKDGEIGDDNFKILSCHLVDERDDAEPAEGKSGLGVFRVSQDYDIYHEEEPT